MIERRFLEETSVKIQRLLYFTFPNKDQTGTAGSFAINKVKGEGSFICDFQRVHEQLDNACVLVKIHGVFLKNWEHFSVCETENTCICKRKKKKQKHKNQGLVAIPFLE